jgi:hypothetical protein
MIASDGIVMSFLLLCGQVVGRFQRGEPSHTLAAHRDGVRGVNQRLRMLDLAGA